MRRWMCHLINALIVLIKFIHKVFDNISEVDASDAVPQLGVPVHHLHDASPHLKGSVRSIEVAEENSVAYKFHRCHQLGVRLNVFD